MSKTDNLPEFLTDMADAIRIATKTTDKIDALDFSSIIANLNAGGGNEVTTGKYKVKVVDYDGTILAEANLDSGETFTLPTKTPSHERLVFQEWSSPVVITDNTITVENGDITVGAVYTTASGLSEFDIELTPATGLTVILTMDGTKDWGDGTSDTENTHTYSSYGKYMITCNGTVMSQTDASVWPYYCINVRLGSNVTVIDQNCFSNSTALQSVTIPNSVTSVKYGAFTNCYLLTTIIIPSSAAADINGDLFNRCYSLKNIVMPAGLSGITGYTFEYCYSLENFTIPSGVTRIYYNTFIYNYSLKKVSFPSSVSQIDRGIFGNCPSLIECDFTKHTSVPNVVPDELFTTKNPMLKIIVPDELYDAWIAVNNWSKYANYIYKASEVTV